MCFEDERLVLGLVYRRNEVFEEFIYRIKVMEINIGVL